jgi:hypothetical protein
MLDEVAAYKYAYFLVQSSNRQFDHVRPAGTKAFASGIFRCQGCGREVVASRGQQLPTTDHHEHPAEAGPVRWRVAVASQG